MSIYPINPLLTNQCDLSKGDSTDDQGSLVITKRKTQRQGTVKYKTQICKNFSEMGYCPYSNKCQFAHGCHELVKYNIETKKAYRTKKCKSFWEDGKCRYGFRCQFLHYQVPQQKDSTLTVIANLLMKFPTENKSSRLKMLFERAV